MSDAADELEVVTPDLAADTVLRRLSDSGPSMVSVDLATGERFPTSGAFKPDADGVSVFRDGVLAASHLDCTAIVKAHQNLVVSLPVVAVREIKPLDVADDPWPSDVPDPTSACYIAHALITGWDGLGKKTRRARQRELARHAELRFVHG